MDRERIGKYTIIGELGRGTMGEVYKAHDPVLNRFVALKILPLHLGPDSETLERFQREARAAALLNHPNIVTVHDFGEEEGLLYMAMELLEGTDLREAIDRQTLTTLGQKLAVMDSVLAALDYAHHKAVIHRDVKPANIHIGRDHQVKIMDFGLARVGSSEMTQEGIVLGTPNYMSPEQALGDRVDARTDLFSAGAVFYELLTGHKPFEADTTPSVLFQVVHKQPPPLRRWAPELPEALVAVVNRALEKDLQARFPSAGDMRAALAIVKNGTNPAQSAVAPRAAGSAPTPSRPRLAPPPLPARPAPKPSASGSGSIPPPLRPQASSSQSGSRPTVAKAPARKSRRGPILAGAERAAPARHAEPRDADAGAREEAAPARRDRAREQELQTGDRGGARGAEALRDQRRRSPRDRPGAGPARHARPLARRGAAAARGRRQRRRLARAAEGARHRRRVPAGGRDRGAPQRRLQGASRRRRELAEGRARGGPLRRRFAGGAPGRRRDGEPRAGAGGARRVRAGDGELHRGEGAARRARRGAAPPAAAHEAPAEVASTTPVTQPTPPPSRSFTPEATRVTAPGGTPAGFDGAQISGRAPQFTGQMEFEVLPPAVRPGEPFVVRIHLRNDGRKVVRIRALSVTAVVDGQRQPAQATPLMREVQAQSRALVAEYSGVWKDARDWALEAIVTADKDETVASRLKAN
jgi:serine/threonine protein kinase